MVSMKIKSAEEALMELENIAPNPPKFQAIQSILEWKHREEILWKQWSRISWLQDGDKNTKFFHSYATSHKRNNMIRKLLYSDGRMVDSELDITKEVVVQFQKIFTQPSPSQEAQSNMELNVNYLPFTVIQDLSQPYSEEEITAALFDFHPSKASGPNGLPAIFYQKFWPQIRLDVVDYCFQVLNEGRTVKDINTTNIALIPKVQQPETMKQFRPISLCNVLYKLISKTVAKRMKSAMSATISPEQSAFLQERLKTDNVSVAYELLHTMRDKRRGKSGCCALKLDMSKAYDKVSWKFIEMVMEKMKFPQQMIATIMDCISTITYAVIINGQTQGQIIPSRGLRQGDPISLYVFLICSEGLSALIHDAIARKKLTGVRASWNGLAVSHLLFADDSLVFCKTKKQEAENLRKILRTYENMSGQQVNFDKSGLFFSPNTLKADKMMFMDTFGVKQCNSVETYLGLPTHIG